MLESAAVISRVEENCPFAFDVHEGCSRPLCHLSVFNHPDQWKVDPNATKATEYHSPLLELHVLVRVTSFVGMTISVKVLVLVSHLGDKVGNSSVLDPLMEVPVVVFRHALEVLLGKTDKPCVHEPRELGKVLVQVIDRSLEAVDSFLGLCLEFRGENVKLHGNETRNVPTCVKK